MANVLIIDDEEAVRLSLAEVVTILGHSARCAEDGRAGLAALDREPFDVVITDLLMPEVNGIEVLRAARQRDPDLGVLVVTGHGGPEPLATTVNLDVDGYIRKPFQIQHLAQQLELALERRADAPSRSPWRQTLRGSVRLLWLLVAAFALLGLLLLLRP
jgi:DNA-binding NtrC family response regulator